MYSYIGNIKYQTEEIFLIIFFFSKQKKKEKKKTNIENFNTCFLIILSVYVSVLSGMCSCYIYCICFSFFFFL